MDTTKEDFKWVNYIKKAVAHLTDDSIYTNFIHCNDTSGHLSIKKQELIAKSLINFIEQNIEWQANL
jgi:hypothetical protein